jgi:hypothetical protein
LQQVLFQQAAHAFALGCNELLSRSAGALTPQPPGGLLYLPM